jgi:hypothetical protein
MVRMLGFSEEEKQTIGLAQNNSGKGVVRGVLGLPGRLVGGIVGGSSPGKSTQASQDSQVGSIFSITLVSSFTTLFFSRQSPSVFFITSHHVDRYRYPLVHSMQSFADLWVDFLLKETEEREKQEREKREASEAAGWSQEESQTTTSGSNSSSVQPSQPQANLAPGPSTRPHLLGRPESDFSTVPLATYRMGCSSVQTSLSRPPPR